MGLALFVGSRAAGKASREDVAAYVRDGATVLDVRTPGEFQGGHVQDAVNIPVQELAARISELGEPGKVVVYCASGMRSARAVGILASHGFDAIDAGTRARF